MTEKEEHSIDALRLRLRRLLSSLDRVNGDVSEKKDLLGKLTQETALALACLHVYSGPQSAELFRLSFTPVEVESRREERLGVECLQFYRIESGKRHGLLPRYTSLLTSPQAEVASAGMEKLVASLWDYINSALIQRAASSMVDDLRRVLASKRKETLRLGGLEEAQRAAHERILEMEHHRRRIALKR